MQLLISVVIPVYNDSARLEKTLQSLKHQTYKNFEVIVVDDCSPDNSFSVAEKYADNVLRNEKNSGPAITRNKGIKQAKGDIIAFTDSDVVVTKNWIESIHDEMEKGEAPVLMGRTLIPKSTYLGDSISELGFPGGANAGFENIWKVDENGITDHITSCNFAAKKEIFDKYGLFDETFPLAGGEDPELSYRLTKNNVKIKYCPEILVYHDPRSSFISFWKWMIYRGRSNYHFKLKLKKVGGFIKLRFWSSKNILMKNLFDIKLPMVFFLLFLSFVLQQYGFMIEKYKR